MKNFKFLLSLATALIMCTVLFTGGISAFEEDDFDTDVITDDVVDVIEEVIITFSVNGGNGDDMSILAVQGEPIGELPIPTRAGCEFMGWFTTSVGTGGQQITSNTIAPANDITYYARWGVALYFDANGGSVSTSSKVSPLGGTVGTLPTPTKSGYVFMGWFNTYATSGGTQITASSSTPSTSTTYYARWGITLTFNANGGSGSSTLTRVPNTIVSTLPSNPTWSGHTFVGWFDSNGDKFTTTSFVPSQNTTYYARWNGSATLTTSGSMSIQGTVGQTLNSTTLTFNGSSLPSNSVIESISIDRGNPTTSSGVIKGNNIQLTSTKRSGTLTIPWANSHPYKDTQFLAGYSANATYTVKWNGTVTANSPSTIMDPKGTVYPAIWGYGNVKLTINYTVG